MKNPNDATEFQHINFIGMEIVYHPFGFNFEINIINLQIFDPL